MRPGDCFWDVGAHKGFVTLAAARMVGPSGSVVSIEPSARNLWFVHKHVEWNSSERIRVVAGAVSDQRRTALFGGRGDSLAYTLGAGDETVEVRTVPGIVEEFDVEPPSVMKIDAEGEEAAVLRGAGDLVGGELALLISVHGRPLHSECSDLLRARGFRLFESWEMARCSADPAHPWTSDYDLLAIGPDRAVDENAIRSLALITQG